MPLVSFIAFMLTPVGSSPVDVGTPRSLPARPAIIVKELEAVHAVYVEHVGPYWSTGPTFAKLAGYMQENGLTGPMYIRYLDDPVVVQANELRSQIGVIGRPLKPPDKPFHSTMLTADRVATLTVSGSSASTRRGQSRLRRWVVSNGYVATGPIMEVYRFSEETGLASAQPQAEIRIPIRDAQPERMPPDPVVVTPSVASANPQPDEPSPDAPAPEVESVQPLTTSESPAPVVSQEEDVTIKSATPAAPETTRDQAIPQTQTVDASQPSPGPRPAAPSIAELVAAGKYDDVAHRLLPESSHLDPNLRAWIKQALSRLNGIAKGVGTIYPGEEDSVLSLVAALHERYEAVFPPARIGTLASRSTQTDGSIADVADLQAAIIREIDLLMGRIAFKQSNGAQTLAAITQIVQRMYDLIHNHGD